MVHLAQLALGSSGALERLGWPSSSVGVIRISSSDDWWEGRVTSAASALDNGHSLRYQ